MYHRPIKNLPVKINSAIACHFDGSCDRGSTAYGAVIRRNGKVIWQASEPIPGRGTCNTAEYSGLIACLRWLLDQGMEHEPILVLGDSQMVMSQMFGTMKIRGGAYVTLALQARNLLFRFPRIRGEWIPREFNFHADRLSKGRTA